MIRSALCGAYSQSLMTMMPHTTAALNVRVLPLNLSKTGAYCL
ncbi:hypothetical protein V12B01_12855 [Vibrio splendidus 12B01]|nr:hypothetical protein V12B01_12855 [Vibrio splendidus 12B01]